MAFSIPNGAFKLQGTEPDYGAAIDTGIQRGLKPKHYAEQLLSTMLANKVKGVEAQFAPQRQQAELDHLLAQTQGLTDSHGLNPLRAQLLKAKYDKAMRGPAPPKEVQLLKYLLANKDKFKKPEEAQQPIPEIGEGQDSFVNPLFPKKQESQPDYASSLYDNVLNKLTGNKNNTDTNIGKLEKKYYSDFDRYGETDPRTMHSKGAWDKAAGNSSSSDMSDYRKKRLEQMDKNINAGAWDHLPPNTKSHLIAIGQGAGIRGDETEKWIRSGKDFGELLYQHGYDEQHPPDPIFELTGNNITQFNNREYAGREIKALSGFIKDAAGEYADRVGGLSPQQVMDSIQGKNKETQARYLAARSLAPELVNLRLVFGNAKSTVHAQKSMAEKSLLEMKTLFPAGIDKDVWKRAQEITDEQLEKAYNFSKKGYGAPTLKEKLSKEATKETQEIVEYVRDSNGRLVKKGVR